MSKTTLDLPNSDLEQAQAKIAIVISTFALIFAVIAGYQNFLEFVNSISNYAIANKIEFYFLALLLLFVQCILLYLTSRISSRLFLKYYFTMILSILLVLSIALIFVIILRT